MASFDTKSEEVFQYTPNHKLSLSKTDHPVPELETLYVKADAYDHRPKKGDDGHGKYNYDYGHVSDDEPKPNNNHLIGQDYNHDKERPKLGHNYSPPTSVPKKDPHPKDKHNDPKLHKRNDYKTPPYKVPMITPPPRNDHTRYEQSNNTHHRPRDLLRSGAMHQPRKEHQGRPETIDSGARRRYATASPQRGVYIEEKYARTIDSVTAARKYKGVLPPN